MAEDLYPFQPGTILHDAIMGAFRARGGSFEQWLQEQGIPAGTARGATYGQSKGPRGTALLGRILEAAGPEQVWALYVARLNRHVDDVKARVA
ncbi:hypothetical protein RSWS8N_18019 [Cereibacter sphaeroides WS8N]|uniref:hypothetical protein n=1 Tax=Cereibacter sphaeroides TaxID=1063 RepID=UPI00020B0313|nr:hypothetical protein [Cereibacter sphaeroides]EGJ20082.1 hypothetical protein RSWS8N_18019 [Cereibacter sphaeroides WS8N]